MRRSAITRVVCFIAPLLLAAAKKPTYEGYPIRPPPGFTAAEPGAYRGSQLGVISADPQAKGYLAAAYVNNAVEGTPTLMISVVEGGFRATPSSRDEFAAAAIKHFEDLRFKFAIDRVDLIAPFVELTGTLIDDGKKRHLVVAAMPGRTRHAVVVFSVPLGELARMVSVIRTFLNSFPIEESAAFWTGDRIAVSAALVGAGILTWMLLLQI
jgi:hypothetical protein